jgi:hypothetical protein
MREVNAGQKPTREIRFGEANFAIKHEYVTGLKFQWWPEGVLLLVLILGTDPHRNTSKNLKNRMN